MSISCQRAHLSFVVVAAALAGGCSSQALTAPSRDASEPPNLEVAAGGAPSDGVPRPLPLVRLKTRNGSILLVSGPRGVEASMFGPTGALEGASLTPEEVQRRDPELYELWHSTTARRGETLVGTRTTAPSRVEGREHDWGVKAR